VSKSRFIFRARRRGVSVKRLGQHYFVLDQSANSIHHLNATAHSVWRIFHAPCSKEAALLMLVTAFPTEAKTKLCADLNTVIESFLEWDLIRRVPS
jgi:hypothetical protein